jgi:hypothetical protein
LICHSGLFLAWSHAAHGILTPIANWMLAGMEFKINVEPSLGSSSEALTLACLAARDAAAAICALGPAFPLSSAHLPRASETPFITSY